MGREEASARCSLQEALTSLCPAYKDLPPEKASSVLEIITSVMEKVLVEQLYTFLLRTNPIEWTLQADAQARFVGVYYINRILPFSHVGARFINLLGAADSKKEVVDEAIRGLKPYIVVDNDLVYNPEAPFPDFNGTHFGDA